jgi:dephospho-CoA kinase
MSPDSVSLAGSVGIAGYMGAGKSTCAAILAERAGVQPPKVRIIDADREAKLLLRDDESVRGRIAEAFGSTAIEEGAFGAGPLGKAAFSSVQSLRTLNGIVHPPLIARLRDLVFSGPAPCILDAALIPMWGIEAWFEQCLWISASPQVRLSRIETKTGLTPDQITLRMSVQESLLHAPGIDTGLWTYIENEGSHNDLQNRLVRATGALFGSLLDGRKPL